MIKCYTNGCDFISENKEFLDTNPYMAVFFYIDCKALKDIDSKNYAIKVEKNGNRLLAIKVEPYNLVLFGYANLTKELLDYMNINHLEAKGIIAEESIGNELIQNHYELMIGMDFMECKEITIPSSKDVLDADESDIDSIYDLSFSFFKDCGLPDIPSKDKIKEMIHRFKAIKKNGKIVSMAAYNNDTDQSYRITHVYTIPSERGKGYAKMIVNAIKNEIIQSGKIATLNVDKKNPISYHIYESIGFKRVFTQGIYNRI